MTSIELAVQKAALLVEDDPFMQGAVNDYLTSLGYHVVTGSSYQDALEELRRASRPFELAVVDIALPFDSNSTARRHDALGLDLVSQIKSFWASTAVVIWSAYTADFMSEFMRLITEEQCSGLACLPKGSPVSKFQVAIDQALNGDVFLNKNALGTVQPGVDTLVLNALSPDVSNAVLVVVDALPQLSAREMEVAVRITKEPVVISQELCLAEKTISHYMDTIYEKLGLKDSDDLQGFRRQPLISLAILIQRLRQ